VDEQRLKDEVVVVRGPNVDEQRVKWRIVAKLNERRTQIIVSRGKFVKHRQTNVLRFLLNTPLSWVAMSGWVRIGPWD